jgi:hypothetical protein
VGLLESESAEETEMKIWLVEMPIAGSVTIEIHAETKEEAIAAFWESDLEDGEVTWEAMSQISQGNTCGAPLNSVRVSEIEDYEEE